MTKKRILIVCSSDRSLVRFRGDFISDLIKANYDVFTAAPNLTPPVVEKLKSFGATPLSYELSRAGLNPIGDLRSIQQLKKLMLENNIDLVFPYTIKPVIYASMAANSLNIPVISLITGLGFTFTGISKKAKILQKVSEFLYKRSIRKNKIIVFQNRDDEKLFRELNILLPQQKTDIVDGSGINLEKFPHRINEKTTENVIFIFVARLIMEKGINLFINAAEAIKSEFPNAEFHILGAPDKTPSAIKMERLNQLHEENIIVYHGIQNDVTPFLQQSDVFVLPTYYREGIPRSILEALSIGMPIITTDTPGCRETVENNENGKILRPQSLEDLIDAMRFFLENPKNIKEMGNQSRKYAEERFDVKLINKKLINLIDQEI
ncbi:glycosyltransferase family 4 protein [Flagellimonas iocasae]|uniref:Glycosyltransferase family 4 protein n=1 Tax=Flagellimonas iocasae TaxID=2055905 RepID=A0ABW4XU07_9FLAO